MSNALSTMLAQVERLDPDLARRLTVEIENRSTGVGLVWEHHEAESVTLPSLELRPGRRVMLLPPRGVDAQALRRSKKKADKEQLDPLWGSEWRIDHFAGDMAYLVDGDPGAVKIVESRIPEDDDVDPDEPTALLWPREDLVSIANFNDPIYPGLRKTGEVRRGSRTDPEHVVINAENYHALQMLTYTHAGSVDAIYIDPPYNSGAKDWKYNNAFVDAEDKFRHSKWLTFMERRLLVAKRLLNPEDSVLIVTIDEKEYLNLGVLLRQTFPEARIQMVSSVINPAGAIRQKMFSRTDEYIYFVLFGSAGIGLSFNDMFNEDDGETLTTATFQGLRRRGSDQWEREYSPGCFYPVYADDETGRVTRVGNPLPLGVDRGSVEASRYNDVYEGEIELWPIGPNGQDGRWQVSPERLQEQIDEGTAGVRLTGKSAKTGSLNVIYLKSADRKRVLDGVHGPDIRDDQGFRVIEPARIPTKKAKTTWNMRSHNADSYGSVMIRELLGVKRFNFPKSLYAVEDALRFFVKDKPDATILDFFAGSGTTAHAVMRLNKQDGGRRRSISVTNNEVSADEIAELTAKKLRPGDDEWDALGIADYVTKPRIEAAITGKRASDGADIKGEYKFIDEFAMKEGLEANASFWTLTYEDPKYIELGLAFKRIAPLLWMQAGQIGSMITTESHGFQIADTYAVLFDCDQMNALADELSSGEHADVKHVFVITDHQTWWQDASDVFVPMFGASFVHRLYKSYLSNFEIEGGK